MNITHAQNTKSVEEFAVYIQRRLQSNTRNWWEVATAFSEARDMYGTGSKQFKELSKITRFSESTIAKMISIINSDRLKKYAVSLSSVHSWGTLYAISSLTDEQFEALKVKYKLDEQQTLAPFITQADVSRFKKEPSKRSVFRGYAIVQVDDEAVKGGLLDGKEYEELLNLLEKMETLSSYVAVKRVGNDEKEELSRLSRVDNKVQQIIRRVYTEGINAALAKYTLNKGETTAVLRTRVLGKNRDELMMDFELDAEEAFKYLGLDYNMAAFYKQAESEVNAAERALADKYAKKVLSRLPVVKEPEEDERAAIEQMIKDLAKTRGFKKVKRSDIAFK